MSINVKNARAEELITKLRKRAGKGTTDFLLDLLEREDERQERDFEAKLARAMEENARIRDRFNSRPLLDPRPLDEMIEYDEDGLPV